MQSILEEAPTAPDPKVDFDCDQCGRNFRLLSSRRRHMRKCRREDQQCRMCEQKIAAPVTVERHMSLHHGITRIFTCECCNWWFGSQKEQRRHILSMIETGQPGDAFAIAKNDREHGFFGLPQKHYAKSASPAAGASTSTPIRGKYAPDIAKLTDLLKPIMEENFAVSFEPQMKDDILSSNMNTVSHLLHVRKNHDEDHQCQLCEQKISEPAIKEHMLLNHGINRVFICDCCNWSFGTHREQRRHVLSMIETGQPGDAIAIAKRYIEAGSFGLSEKHFVKSASPAASTSSSTSLKDKCPPNIGTVTDLLKPMVKDNVAVSFEQQTMDDMLMPYVNTGEAPFAGIPLEWWAGFFLAYPDVERHVLEITERDRSSEALLNYGLPPLNEDMSVNFSEPLMMPSEVSGLELDVNTKRPPTSAGAAFSLTGELSDICPIVDFSLEGCPTFEQAKPSITRQLKRRSDFCLDDLLLKKMRMGI